MNLDDKHINRIGLQHSITVHLIYFNLNPSSASINFSPKTQILELENKYIAKNLTTTIRDNNSKNWYYGKKKTIQFHLWR